jgi:LysM repeat protein
MKEAMNQMQSVTTIATAKSRVVTPTKATYIRRRIMVALVFAFAIFGAVSLATGQAQAVGAGTGQSTAETSFTYVTIHAGDTLWSLADTYAGDTDPRDWIAGLVTLNALESNNLQPGQKLALPRA